MSRLTQITFAALDLMEMDKLEGRVAICVTPDGKLDQGARRANRLTRGAVARMVESKAFEKVKSGQIKTLAWPTGMAAEALDIVIMPNRPTAMEARKAGVALAKLKARAALTIVAGTRTRAEELAMGVALRNYSFDAHKTDDEPEPMGAVVVQSTRHEDAAAAAAPLLSVAEGVAMTGLSLLRFGRGSDEFEHECILPSGAFQLSSH